MSRICFVKYFKENCLAKLEKLELGRILRKSEIDHSKYLVKLFAYTTCSIYVRTILINN